MQEILEPVLQGGSLAAALWMGVFGTALLLLVGLLRRSATGRARAQRLRAEREARATAEVGQRRRVERAYATSPEAAAPSALSAALPPALSPTAEASCPAELSRRLDRLEARVLARRAGGHG
ncbi:hypothetical protein FJ251_13025 [bacterium]|nr:hypothetical protein [bacterium]